MTKLLVIGIDGASWNIIKPNIDQLPYFKKLMSEGVYKSLYCEDEEILSAAIWCTIFSGKTLKEHGHRKFVESGKLIMRKDIKVDFVWDILSKKSRIKNQESRRNAENPPPPKSSPSPLEGEDQERGWDIRALQIPFVIPPYNFNCEYEPPEYGASSDLNILEKDTNDIAFKAIEILKEKPDVFAVVFAALDKVQHFHWGEPIILSWYKKMDEILGMLEKYGEKLMVMSDHGFCDRGKARVKTLPEFGSTGQEIKGDHHEEAMLITRGINYDIKEHKDIYNAIIANLH